MGFLVQPLSGTLNKRVLLVQPLSGTFNKWVLLVQPLSGTLNKWVLLVQLLSGTLNKWVLLVQLLSGTLNKWVLLVQLLSGTLNKWVLLVQPLSGTLNKWIPLLFQNLKVRVGRGTWFSLSWGPLPSFSSVPYVTTNAGSPHRAAQVTNRTKDKPDIWTHFVLSQLVLFTFLPTMPT